MEHGSAYENLGSVEFSTSHPTIIIIPYKYFNYLFVSSAQKDAQLSQDCGFLDFKDPPRCDGILGLRCGSKYLVVIHTATHLCRSAEKGHLRDAFPRNMGYRGEARPYFPCERVGRGFHGAILFGTASTGTKSGSETGVKG